MSTIRLSDKQKKRLSKYADTYENAIKKLLDDVEKPAYKSKDVSIKSGQPIIVNTKSGRSFCGFAYPSDKLHKEVLAVFSKKPRVCVSLKKIDSSVKIRDTHAINLIFDKEIKSILPL